MYQAWKSEISSRGNVNFKLGHTVTRVVSRNAKESGAKVGVVQIEYSAPHGDMEGAVQTASFDELILAIDANSALKLLGRQASWMEKRVLGSVKYLYDVTITHNDIDYMKKVRLPYFSSSMHDTKSRPHFYAVLRGCLQLRT